MNLLNGSLNIVIQGQKRLLLFRALINLCSYLVLFLKIEFNFLTYNQIYHHPKFTSGVRLRCSAIYMFLNGGILEKCHDGFVGVIK